MAKAINAEFSDEDEDDDNKSNWDDEEKVSFDVRAHRETQSLLFLMSYQYLVNCVIQPHEHDEEEEAEEEEEEKKNKDDKRKKEKQDRERHTEDEEDKDDDMKEDDDQKRDVSLFFQLLPNITADIIFLISSSPLAGGRGRRG